MCMQVYTVAFMMAMYMYIPGVLPIHALQTCTYFQTLHLCIVFVYMCKCINRLADLTSSLCISIVTAH